MDSTEWKASGVRKEALEQKLHKTVELARKRLEAKPA